MWDGAFVFGEASAAYRGPASDNTPHAHAALQLAFGLPGRASVELAPDRALTADAVLIGAGVRHRLVGEGPVGLIYVEPQTVLGTAWLGWLDGRAASPAPADVMAHIDLRGGPEAWLIGLDALTQLGRILRRTRGWLGSSKPWRQGRAFPSPRRVRPQGSRKLTCARWRGDTSVSPCRSGCCGANWNVRPETLQPACRWLRRLSPAASPIRPTMRAPCAGCSA